tara:strand:- start:297 stop:1319 length:1023 start_codon:yes stop_codon:yes gene_type:complete
MDGTRKVRTVVVGSGFGESHLSALMETGRCEPVRLIYRSNKPRAQKIADRYSIPSVSDDISSAFECESDLVVICTPVYSHFELSKAALERGRMVSCDKPLSLNVSEAFELSSLAEGLGISTLTFFQWRQHGGCRCLKDYLTRGALGAVREIHGSFDHDFLAANMTDWDWRHKTETAGAGALADLGVHLIDLQIWLMDEVPEVTGAASCIVYPQRLNSNGRSIQCETEDISHAEFHFPGSDAMGSFRASRVSTGMRRIVVSIIGEFASVDLCIATDTGAYEINFHGDGPAAGKTPVPAWPNGSLYTSWFSALSEGRPWSPSFREGAIVQSVSDQIVELANC